MKVRALQIYSILPVVVLSSMSWAQTSASVRMNCAGILHQAAYSTSPALLQIQLNQYKKESCQNDITAKFGSSGVPPRDDLSSLAQHAIAYKSLLNLSARWLDTSASIGAGAAGSAGTSVVMKNPPATAGGGGAAFPRNPSIISRGSQTQLP
jgi:hypothetical protein